MFVTSNFPAEKETYKNTYGNAHKSIESLIEAQNSKEKRTKRICVFQKNDIGNKGLIKIDQNNLKIQVYRIEMKNPTEDSFNSAYLYETNGIIKSDSSFVIKSETEFRTNKTTTKNPVDSKLHKSNTNTFYTISIHTNEKSTKLY